MNDFMKMAVPIVLTLMLSALGTGVYTLYNQVQTIGDKQIEGQQYVLLIQQLRKEVDDHEARLRAITQACLTHAETYEHEEDDTSTTNSTTYVSASRELD